MSLKKYQIDWIQFSFPRVSGDEPGALYALPTSVPFSPRERG